MTDRLTIKPAKPSDAAEIADLYGETRRVVLPFLHPTCSAIETQDRMRDRLLARAFHETHGFRPVAFRDGSQNEEGVQDVVYEWRADILN